MSQAKKVLPMCEDFIDAQFSCEEVLSQSPFSSVVCELENAIIDLHSGSLLDGFSYATTFSVGTRVYTRHLDSGILDGSSRLLLDKVNATNGVSLSVLSKKDLEDRVSKYWNNRNSESTSDPSKSGVRWKDLVFNNSKSVDKKLEHLKTLSSSNIQLIGACVVLRKKERVSIIGSSLSNYDRFHGCFDATVGQELESHRLTRCNHPVTSFFDNLEEAAAKDVLSFSEQAAVMNALSNDPTPQGRTGVRCSQYFSYAGPKHAPTSLRCRLVKALHERSDNKLENVLLDIVKKFGGSSAAAQAPPAKRARCDQKSQPRPASSARSTYSQPMEVDSPFDGAPDLPPSVSTTPYREFVCRLVEKGKVSWRIHEAHHDVIVMNDVKVTEKDARMSVNSFVSVIRHRDKYFCDCSLFDLLSVSAPDSAECVHIMFWKEYITPLSDVTKAEPISSSDNTVTTCIKQAYQDLKKPVVRLDVDKRYHRLSVLTGSENDEQRHQCIMLLEKNRVSCTAGLCRSRKSKSKKRLTRKLGQPEDCDHMKALSAHRSLWEYLVKSDCKLPADAESLDEDSDYEDEELEDDAEGDVEAVINDEAVTADLPIKLNSRDVLDFDEDSGMWVTGSFSQHKPLPRDHPSLVAARQKRLLITPQSPGYAVDTEGFIQLSTPNGLEPLSLKNSLDRSKKCKCQLQYWDEEHPEGSLKPSFGKPLTLYMEHGAAKCQVYHYECLNQNPDCRISYSGQQDGIHILSKNIAGVEELGWRYLDLSMNSMFNFSCFHKFYSSVYSDFGLLCNFMGADSMKAWHFSWMANWKLEFREQCIECGENPEMLAGDGTKSAGVLFRNSNFTPIETSASSEPPPKPNHKRNDRQFFQYSSEHTDNNVKAKIRQAREDLNYFVCKHTDRLEHFKPKNKTAIEESDRRESVLAHAPSACKEILDKFIDASLLCFVQVAVILSVLVTEKPVSSLINFRHLDLVEEVCQEVEMENLGSIEKLRNDMGSICELFKVASCDPSELKLVIDFVRYLASHVREVHANDPDVPPVGHYGKYNPPKNVRAYYFTKDGAQLRPAINYPKEKKEKKENADPDACNKYSYAIASKSGSTYLYFMFEPRHYGHCYGFHMLENEGAKDAFSPVFQYMERAPKEFVSDNACIVEEFALNREPKFWRESRFCHDCFHGYHHKCPFTYNSKRIPSLSTMNTEICEQFNAYMKKIRFSSMHMSQTRFTFYVQFFIYQWNKKQREAYLAKKKVAESFFSW